MSSRIYTAAEAQALRDAASLGPLHACQCCVSPTHDHRWSVCTTGGTAAAEVAKHGDRGKAIAELFAAAPDLAGTVVRLAARVEYLEGMACAHDTSAIRIADELDRARVRAWAAQDECRELRAKAARLGDECESLTAERDAALHQCEDLTRALTALRDATKGETT